MIGYNKEIGDTGAKLLSKTNMPVLTKFQLSKITKIYSKLQYK
jgi:hypothetical protein